MTLKIFFCFWYHIRVVFSVIIRENYFSNPKDLFGTTLFCPKSKMLNDEMSKSIKMYSILLLHIP
jgi:hypothetical protein